jgi:hypothetical protein
MKEILIVSHRPVDTDYSMLSMRLNHEQRTLYREEILIGREEIRLRVLLPLTDEDEYVSVMSEYVLT